MSDTPPSDPEDDRVSGIAPEPFVRGRIVWGRPPETVFRAGPLPRAPQTWGQPAPSSAPQPRPAGNILTGSMVPPRAAPAPERELLPGERPLAPDPDAAPETPVEPAAAKPRRARKTAPLATPEVETPVVEAPAVETPIVEAPIVEAYSEPSAEPGPESIIETIVEPEPVRPAAAPAPTVEIIVEPEAPEQIDTLPPPLSDATVSPADPRAMPSVVVTPTLYARVEAVMEKVKTNDTWRIAAVAGAVIVVAGFVWLATLPAGDAPVLDMDAPPPAAPGAAAAAAAGAETSLPAEAAPSPSEAPPPAIVEPEAATARSEATRAPTRAEPAPPVPPRAASTSTPRVTSPPAEAAVPPVIQTAPLVVEPPTAAAPAPTDPDAPIETRPQPLN